MARRLAIVGRGHGSGLPRNMPFDWVPDLVSNSGDRAGTGPSCRRSSASWLAEGNARARLGHFDRIDAVYTSNVCALASPTAIAERCELGDGVADVDLRFRAVLGAGGLL